MAFISILLFFLYTWGLGFGATRWMKNSENFFERNLIRIGIGLGIIPLLIVIFNVLHIAIMQEIFMVLALAGPIYALARERKVSIPPLRLTKSNLAVLIAVIIFFASLFIYSSGAFKYPYLENDDPWGHAAASKYVADEKTVSQSEYRTFQYLSPYPPGYDGFLGLMAQSNDSVYWTLKFFNALIISLGILFFFFFAREFTGSLSKSLIATFILASVPCYLSHFIWAHALTMTLFFPAMYCLEMIKHDRKWIFPASFVISGLMVSDPTTALKLVAMMGIYFAVKSIAMKKFSVAHFSALALGSLLSLFWWAPNAKGFFSMVENGGTTVGEAVASNTNLFVKIFHIIQGAFPTDSGTASRAYSFSDFFMAQKANMINNPIGIGVAVSVLAIIGLAVVCLRYRSWLQEKGGYLLITLCWGVFAFLGVNSITFNLPIGFFAFRFWMILAVPVALLAAEGIMLLSGMVNMKAVKAAIIVALIVAVTFTSGIQKYAVNTAPWGAGAFWTYEMTPQGPQSYELAGYVWLHTLPPNTKVFSFLTDDQVIGFDKFSCGWCKDESELRKRGLNITGEEMHSWMLEHGYQYLLVGGMEVRNFGQDAVDSFIDSIQNSTLFSLAHQTNGLIVLKA
ncbi:MAG: hypothetical protein V1702_04265 [Candidatus Woesearchaeota archaeon]